MRRRPRKLTEEERALWNSVASTATPRPGHRPGPAEPCSVEPHSPESARGPDQATHAPAQPLPGKRRPAAWVRPVAPERPPVPHDLALPLVEALGRAPVRMDRKTHTRLKGGRLEPEARIDLHGLTLARAHSALAGFILRSRASGVRLALVITGKGRGSDDSGPIPERRGLLREQVPQWLAQPPLAGAVLQIVPAHRRHGGAGAYYVYLRRADR